MRFIAGIGLAGELGAGITLVSETMTQKHRGYGTMLVVSFGVLGAVAANLVALNGAYFTDLLFDITGKHFSNWQVAYIIGGVLGIFLLILRIGVYESHMYKELADKTVSRGNFLKLFSSKKLFTRYLCCIAIGVPIWYMIGILIALAKDISIAKGVPDVVTGNAVMYFYIGTSFGDFMSGYLSQIFKSRIKIVFFYLSVTVIAVPMYLYIPVNEPTMFYWICAFLGFAAGFWAVFVTIASEQFGTNIRSTVTTTVPNFVRGSLVLLTILLNIFRKDFHIDLLTSCLMVGIISVGISFFALNKLEETYHKELGYTELM
jgi:MFS transporter, putative metabolite:H+ symporter